MKGCFCSDKKRWSEILKEKSKYFWVKQVIEKFSLKIGSDKFSIKHVLGAIELFLISTRIIGSGNGSIFGTNYCIELTLGSRRR